jgi:hypothetical protein
MIEMPLKYSVKVTVQENITVVEQINKQYEEYDN